MATRRPDIPAAASKQPPPRPRRDADREACSRDLHTGARGSGSRRSRTPRRGRSRVRHGDTSRGDQLSAAPLPPGPAVPTSEAPQAPTPRGARAPTQDSKVLFAKLRDRIIADPDNDAGQILALNEWISHVPSAFMVPKLSIEDAAMRLVTFPVAPKV